MEVILAATALGVGVLAAVLPFIAGSLSPGAAQAKGRVRVGAPLALGATLTVVFFLIALPEEAPFSAGLRLGWGFLIGGATALVGAWAAARVLRADRPYWPHPSGLVTALVLAAVSLVVLVFAGDPVDALLGCAFGIVIVAGTFRTMLPSAPASENNGGLSASLGLTLEGGAVFSVTLATGCALAVYHFNQTALRGWWAYLPALAALWVAGQTVVHVLGTHLRAGRLSRPWVLAAALVTLALVLMAGWRIGAKLQPAQSLEMLLVSGSVTIGLIVWLALAIDRSEWPRAMRSHALAAGLILFLVVASFKLLAGLGTAIAMVAAWGIAALAAGVQGAVSRMPVQALAVGANLLLLRVFMERSGRSLGDAEFAFHYTLIGLIIGAVLPFVYSSLHLRPGLRRALLLGGLAALSPLAMLALWGSDAALGLLAGLVAAQAITLLLQPIAETMPDLAAWQAPSSLVALLTGLAAVQFTRPFSYLYEMPRAYKVYVACGIALVVILWIVASALAQVRRKRRAAAPGTQIPGTEA
jgi:hypothetical protein